MKLSLSVRIVEAACKTKLNMPLERFLGVARQAGYQAVCMRASAGGVQTPHAQLAEMRRQVERAGLRVSMVTADFDVPLNNARGPNSLRDIRPSLAVAEAFGCDLIRICMKTPDDIPHAIAAADVAAERNIRLAHQCHTSSLFEEVGAIQQTLAQIDRENFGIIYEPANLMLCGQSYGEDALRALRPHLMNVYLQNHRLDENGPVSLPTYCRGEVRFHHLEPWAPGGVDCDAVFAALKAVGYDGFFTIHQAQGIETEQDASAFARRCAEFVRQYID